MGYIPKHALENLNEYQYKGVDKQVHAPSRTSAHSRLTDAKVSALEICFESILELACDVLANVGRPKCRKLTPFMGQNRSDNP